MRKKSAICLWLEVRDGVTLPKSEEDDLNKATCHKITNTVQLRVIIFLILPDQEVKFMAVHNFTMLETEQ